MELADIRLCGRCQRRQRQHKHRPPEPLQPPALSFAPAFHGTLFCILHDVLKKGGSCSAQELSRDSMNHSVLACMLVQGLSHHDINAYLNPNFDSDMSDLVWFARLSLSVHSRLRLLSSRFVASAWFTVPPFEAPVAGADAATTKGAAVGLLRVSSGRYLFVFVEGV